MPAPPTTLTLRSLDQCRIDDESAMRGIGLYTSLKQVLRRDDYRVRILPPHLARWDHALLLNLTLWQPSGGGDVLVDDAIPADVVCHMAWHHLAARALADDGAPLSAEALALGESVASAFDIYLVGRMLTTAPQSDFLETQVPAMADAAAEAGVEAAAFEALLAEAQAHPEQAFGELRALLYDAVVGLWRCRDADEVLALLQALDGRRWGCLLHHFEVANWVQAVRQAPPNASAARATETDAALRAAPDAIAWLERAWLQGT
jgi:hypothetical protein